MAPGLLLVLSERRSGSTFLSETLARVLPCAVALGEPLLHKASSGGYAQWPFAGALSTALARRRHVDPHAWLAHVRAHACGARACACIGVAKVFRTHAIEARGLRTLVGAAGVASVVLERNATDAECSLRWAQRTADWANTPRERRVSGRSAEYAHFRARCAASATFAAAHDAWFATARHARIALEVPFRDLVERTSRTLRRVAFALNVTLLAWRPTPFHDAPVTRTTLALVVIVRRHAERLPPWLAHHTRSGADEVALYSTPSMHAAVERAAAAARVAAHWPLAEAVAAANGSAWSYAWQSCRPCCRPLTTHALVRAAPLAGMCARRMYMPEQAHAVRHAVRRLASTWLLHLDLDEYLAADGSAPDAWRAYLATLGARRHRPGGVRVPQLQMVRGALNAAAHLVAQPSRWAEHKCLVRRDALHADPRAYGSVHEVTLGGGEFYVRAPQRVLALLHYRHAGWRADRRAEVGVRLAELGCGAASLGPEVALICKSKRSELVRWDAQLRWRPRAQLDVARLPRV